jgi:hypothetical protein
MDQRGRDAASNELDRRYWRFVWKERSVSHTESVPQLDALVARAGQDLPVADPHLDQAAPKKIMKQYDSKFLKNDGGQLFHRVNEPVVVREGHREHILGVANEAAGGGPVVEVPQAEGAIPRAREGELPVGAHHDVLQAGRIWSKIDRTANADDCQKKYLYEVGVSLQAAAGLAERALLASQLPDKEGLVSRCAHDHGVVVKRRAVEEKNYKKRKFSTHTIFMAQTLPRWQWPSHYGPS